MKIKHRIFLFFGFSLVGLTIAIWLIVGNIIHENFGGLEERSAQDHMRKISLLYDAKIKNVVRMTNDWALWDDTYDFVQGQKEEFRESNLLDDMFVMNEINAMIYLNADQKIVAEKFVDLQKKEEIPFPPDLKQQIFSRKKIVQHALTDKPVYGVLMTESGPFLFCARSILRSTGEGPVAGTLFVGKLFDSVQIQEFSKEAFAPIQVYAVNKASDKAMVSGILSQMSKDKAIHLKKANEKELHGYIKINDVDDQPALIIQSELPRDVYAQGRLLTRVLIFAILFTATAIFLVLLFLIDAQLVYKLILFQKGVQAIADKGRTDLPLDIKGPDEIVFLAKAFNHMLETINKKTQMLDLAKKYAEEASSLKSQFLANVSHEIRTPLNSILGFSESILQMDDMAQVKERTKVIFQESEVLLQLINTLLDHAKIEAGKMELVHASVDIRKVVRSVQVSLQGRADKGGIDFQVIVDKAVPGSFLGDAFRLRQIILNLANNAIKFTERGSVRVMVDCMEAEGQKARIRFAVEDTGIGIGEKEQKMVFNAFTQVDGSMGRRYQGTGLGITISRKLVNMMGGDLFLESALGKGSKFWFDLDVEILEHKAKEVPESEETCMGEKDFSNKRILVADDYEPNRQLILLYLEGLKVNVDVVCDGQEAIDICDRNYYDVILMDLQMPKVDGYTATKIIRKKSVFCQRSKIIVMTANAGMEARCQCKDLGVDDIVVKPIRRKTFLERVVRFLVSESVSAFPGHDPSDMKAPSVPYGHMDFMRLVNEFAGNKEVAYSLLRNFVMIAEEQILLIQEAVKANDMQVFQEEIHKMKGASGALMLDRLAEKTTRINALLSDKNYAEGLSLLKGLVEEYQFIKTFVMCYRSHA